MEDQNKAKHKFQNALFVIDELNGELYHSLKFSNEVSSNESKQSPVIREKENRIKSFTFDVGHLKLMNNKHKNYGFPAGSCDTTT